MSEGGALQQGDGMGPDVIAGIMEGAYQNWLEFFWFRVIFVELIKCIEAVFKLGGIAVLVNHGSDGFAQFIDFT